MTSDIRHFSDTSSLKHCQYPRPREKQDPLVWFSGSVLNHVEASPTTQLMSILSRIYIEKTWVGSPIRSFRNPLGPRAPSVSERQEKIGPKTAPAPWMEVGGPRECPSLLTNLGEKNLTHQLLKRLDLFAAYA